MNLTSFQRSGIIAERLIRGNIFEYVNIEPTQNKIRICRACRQPFAVERHKQMKCNACLDQPKRSTGRPPIEINRAEFLDKTSLPRPQAELFLRLARNVREAAIAKYGSLSSAERQLGLRRSALTDVLHPERARELSQLHMLVGYAQLLDLNPGAVS